MTNEQPAELTIQLGLDDGDVEEVDRLTRQLLGELRGYEVESADLVVSGKAAEGAKAADPITIGAIALAALPSVLPKIVELLQSWISRGPGRTIKFKGKVGDQEIEFEGTPRDFQQMVSSLQAQKS
jgi:hypothetical protein